jgi:rubrerythrin
MKQQTPVQQPTEFPPKEASEEVWTCPVCGTVSPKSAKFCMNCGTKQE